MVNVFSDKEVGFFKFVWVLLSKQIIDKLRISNSQNQNNRTEAIGFYKALKPR